MIHMQLNTLKTHVKHIKSITAVGSKGNWIMVFDINHLNDDVCLVSQRMPFVPRSFSSLNAIANIAMDLGINRMDIKYD